MSVLGYRDPPNNNNGNSVPGGFPTEDSSLTNDPQAINGYLRPTQIDFGQPNRAKNLVIIMILRLPLLLLSFILSVLLSSISFIDRFLKISAFYNRGKYTSSHTQDFDMLLESLSSRSVTSLTSPDTPVYNFGSVYNRENGIIGAEQLKSSFVSLLEACSKQCKYGFIYLHDPLLDDAMSFPNEILCTERFVNLIKKYEGLVWMADITTAEALQVANSWKIRRYPYLAVVMVRSGRKAEVVASASGSIDNYDPVKFERQLQQNHGKLVQVAQQRQNAEMERLIRGQQDSRFRESLRRDQERDRVREETRRAEEYEQNQDRMKREWLISRLHKLHPEPSTSENTSRIAIRFENNQRIIRKFDADLPIEEIYAFVALYQSGIMDEADSLPEHTEPPTGFVYKYDFLLISPVPRVELEPDCLIKDCDAIFPSGNILIEDIDSTEE